ncbi:hypothetical protein [Primorskyibacter sp. S187A]|uniref:hypothetical protein n=1 Tax=Primorskyibacter sp. S187A TaxID=3415130 RepID=UPI003C7A5335
MNDDGRHTYFRGEHRTPRVFIDANVLDFVSAERKNAVLKLVVLYESEEVEVILPKGVREELEHPNVPVSVKVLLPDVYTVEVELSVREQQQRSLVVSALQGNAKPGKHLADADHVFEAIKYQVDYFVTYDHRILDRSADIKEVVPNEIEFCDLEMLIQRLSN